MPWWGVVIACAVSFVAGVKACDVWAGWLFAKAFEDAVSGGGEA